MHKPIIMEKSLRELADAQGNIIFNNDSEAPLCVLCRAPTMDYTSVIFYPPKGCYFAAAETGIGGDYIKPFINGFKGWLQTDEYPGYESALKEHNILFPKQQIIHVSCAAHIRRKFYDALLNGKSKGAAKALK